MAEGTSGQPAVYPRRLRVLAEEPTRPRAGFDEHAAQPLGTGESEGGAQQAVRLRGEPASAAASALSRHA